MPTTEKRKPLKLFIPFQRVARVVRAEGQDESTPAPILVEGFTYVNAEVGDGVNLTRAAMEEATADYMTWGAVREMHQASAVGTAVGAVQIERDGGATETVPLGVTWNDRGAYLRCKVVDQAAIAKVTEGVYRGFSVSVAPLVMRGRDLIRGKWIENSLVDRPADGDCPIEGSFSLARAEGSDPNAEVDVEMLDRADTFADYVEDLEEDDLYDDMQSAFYALLSSCYNIMNSGASDREALIGQSIDEFAAYVKAEVLPESVASDDMTPRLLAARDALARSKGVTAADVARFTTLESDLARVQGELATERGANVSMRSELVTAKERVKILEASPAKTRPVVGKTTGVDRDFLAGQVSGADSNAPTRRAAILSEINELSKMTPITEPDEQKRIQAVQRVMVLRNELATLAI